VARAPLPEGTEDWPESGLLAKLLASIARGRRNVACLRRMGWRVCTIWECKVRWWTDADFQHHLRALLKSRAERDEASD
jgi:G:T-mismatch repair DNA endonuclease (very short patch repair protein)